MLFHLGERVSTALELAQRPEEVPGELIDRQLQDALTASQRVNPQKALPLRFNLREGLISLLLVLLLGMVWFRGESWFKAAQQARDVQQAVQEQAAQIEEIINRSSPMKL